MKKALPLFLILLLGATTLQAGDLDEIFPFESEISCGPAGLQRMTLPPEVLRHCSIKLSDLRILDTRGREIPYILDSPLPEGQSLALIHKIKPRVLATKRSRIALDPLSSESRESYTLEIPSAPKGTAGWTLVFNVRLNEFVSRIDVSRIGADGQVSTVVSDGSIFRLPSAGISRTKLPLGPLPPGKILLELRGRDQDYLSPAFELGASRTLRRGDGEGLDLEILSEKAVRSGTEIVAVRPRGLIPRKLLIQSSTPTFRRNISVWDEGSGALEASLGRQEIFRIQAIAPVEFLEIPLMPARGDRLRLLIENQGSPPLEDLRLKAVLPQPVLIFSTRQDAEKMHLYFGGGRARAGNYDIQSLRPPLRRTSTANDAQLAILDPARASQAILGEIHENPRYDDTPALAFAAHPGAQLEAKDYSFRRGLDLQPSQEGLAEIPLMPEDLAKLRPDLGDLRIVDSKGLQWAFLRQDRARALKLPLEIPRPETNAGISRYTIAIPPLPLSPLLLRLQSPAPFFNRDLRCFGVNEDKQNRQLYSGRIARQAGDPRPIFLNIPNKGLKIIRLEISDGDDAPLNFDSLNLTVKAPVLYMPAVAGHYNLLLGNPNAAAPRYEIERIRQTILALPSAEARCGAMEENPAYSRTRRLFSSSNSRKLLLWGLLIFAVLFLTILTLKTARQLPSGSRGED